MEKINKHFGLNSLTLKIIAMICMLCDHMYASIIPGNQWLNDIGRIAFPIFAFELVEGFFHTHDFNKYLKRMFIMALITEIPFNLVAGGGIIYPFHQNVLFTFTIGLIVLKQIHNHKNDGQLKYLMNIILWTMLGSLFATLTFVDYFGYGILMIIVFYLAHELPHSKIVMLVGMVLVNGVLFEGLTVAFSIGNVLIEFPQQAYACLALIPIFLYNGELGPHNKYIKWACYWFYPVHLLILGLIALI